MVIVGLGGTCKDMLNDINAAYSWDELLFYTEYADDPNIEQFRKVPGLQVTANFEDMIDHLRNRDDRFLVLLGDNHARELMVQKMESLGGRPTRFISPFARVIPESCTISERNVVIMKFSNVSVNVTIEEGAIIYAYTAIAHDCYIGRYAFISAYCSGSKFKIGDYSFVGLNTTILADIEIGKEALVGASTLVNKSVPDNMMGYGTPIRIYPKKG